MRRTALRLTVALTALLASSVCWRPLRPGPAPPPGSAPLTFLLFNLGLPPLPPPPEPPGSAAARPNPVGRLPGLDTVRHPAAGADKITQPAARKPVQCPSEQTATWLGVGLW